MGIYMPSCHIESLRSFGRLSQKGSFWEWVLNINVHFYRQHLSKLKLDPSLDCPNCNQNSQNQENTFFYCQKFVESLSQTVRNICTTFSARFAAARQTQGEHRYPWQLDFEPRSARLGGVRSTPTTIAPNLEYIYLNYANAGPSK